MHGEYRLLCSGLRAVSLSDQFFDQLLQLLLGAVGWHGNRAKQFCNTIGMLRTIWKVICNATLLQPYQMLVGYAQIRIIGQHNDFTAPHGFKTTVDIQECGAQNRKVISPSLASYEYFDLPCGGTCPNQCLGSKRCIFEEGPRAPDKAVNNILMFSNDKAWQNGGR